MILEQESGVKSAWAVKPEERNNRQSGKSSISIPRVTRRQFLKHTFSVAATAALKPELFAYNRKEKVVWDDYKDVKWLTHNGTEYIFGLHEKKLGYYKDGEKNWHELISADKYDVQINPNTGRIEALISRQVASQDLQDVVPGEGPAPLSALSWAEINDGDDHVNFSEIGRPGRNPDKLSLVFGQMDTGLPIRAYCAIKDNPEWGKPTVCVGMDNSLYQVSDAQIPSGNMWREFAYNVEEMTKLQDARLAFCGSSVALAIQGVNGNQPGGNVWLFGGRIPEGNPGSIVLSGIGVAVNSITHGFDGTFSMRVEPSDRVEDYIRASSIIYPDPRQRHYHFSYELGQNQQDAVQRPDIQIFNNWSSKQTLRGVFDPIGSNESNNNLYRAYIQRVSTGDILHLAWQDYSMWPPSKPGSKPFAGKYNRNRYALMTTSGGEIDVYREPLDPDTAYRTVADYARRLPGNVQEYYLLQKQDEVWVVCTCDENAHGKHRRKVVKFPLLKNVDLGFPMVRG